MALTPIHNNNLFTEIHVPKITHNSLCTHFMQNSKINYTPPQSIELYFIFIQQSFLTTFLLQNPLRFAPRNHFLLQCSQ